MKIFVINLDKDKSRLEHVKTSLLKYNLDFERFPAVNGKCLPPSELHRVYSAVRSWLIKRPLLPGEIGCALSHIYLYKKIVEEKIPYALILEDDIEVSPELNNFLDNIRYKLNSEKNTVIMVGPRSWNTAEAGEKISENSSVVLRRSFAPYRTCGYIVSYEAAKRLYKFLFPCRTVADDWGRFERYGLVEIWTTDPLLVHLSDADNDSTIGDRAVRRNFLARLFRFARRLTFEKIDYLNAMLYRFKNGY